MTHITRRQLERALRYERKITRAEFEAIAKATQLQAAEYERRLEELNHAHSRAVEEQQRTLPREVFDRFEASYNGFREETIRQLSAAQSRTATWAVAMGLFFGVLVLIMKVVESMGGG